MKRSQVMIPGLEVEQWVWDLVFDGVIVIDEMDSWFLNGQEITDWSIIVEQDDGTFVLMNETEFLEAQWI